MTPETLSRLKSLNEKRTQGEWIIHKEDAYFTPSAIWSSKKRAWDEDDEEYNTICNFSRTSEYGYGCDTHIEPDAEFISEIANHASELLEGYTKMREALEKIKNGGVPDGVFADLGERMFAMCSIAQDCLSAIDGKEGENG